MLTESAVEDARMTPWQRYNLRVQQCRVAMAEHEYETVWNGTMERNGQHPGLSRMMGPSSAQLNMDLPEAVELLTTRTNA
ncbi:MAG: hypothetical protein ABW318_20300 [Vicinamibacterales bacterium]